MQAAPYHRRPCGVPGSIGMVLKTSWLRCWKRLPPVDRCQRAKVIEDRVRWATLCASSDAITPKSNYGNKTFGGRSKESR